MRSRSLWLVDLGDSDGAFQAEEIAQKYGVRAEFVECDLEIEGSRAELIDRVSKSERQLAILVNNAAFVGETNLEGWVDSFESQSLVTWRRAMEVNLTSCFHLAQGLAAKLRESPGASILNVSSMHGFVAPRWDLYEGTSMGSPAAYSVSKAGLIHLTRWLAATLGPQIRVNCVSPGGVFRNQPSDFVNRYERETLLGKMGTEEEIASVVSFLVSEDARYMTGQNVVVDGGYSV